MSNQAQTALLTEHFRYTPLTLLDDIVNTVNELIFRAINAIEEGLSAQPPEALGFKVDEADVASGPDALQTLKQNEIDSGIIKLESLLNATVDRDFDKFEIYVLRNILAVGHGEDADLADWIRLEHYQGLDWEKAAAAPTPEAVQRQRRKLQETTKLNAMLQAEEARNEALIAQLTDLLAPQPAPGPPRGSPFAFLVPSIASASRSPSSRPLTDNVQYALSQLPALRERLAQLQRALHGLPSARRGAGHDNGEDNDDDDDDDYNSVDGKRRQYLDSQARRAMQRRGVDVDAATRATVIGGRNVGRAEVEGLEAVAQALSGATAPARRRRDNDEEMN